MLVRIGSMLYFVILLRHSLANPIFSQTNDSTSADNSSHIVCPHQLPSNQNITLHEVLNHDRLWWISARTTFVFGAQTWNNGLIHTSVDGSGTIEFEMHGEDSNGTCKSSGKGQIVSISESDDVQIQWPENEGHLRMIYQDETSVHLLICYNWNLNQSDSCPYNQTEYLIIHSNQDEVHNDSSTWLHSYCSSISANDFILPDDSNKCLNSVVNSNTIVSNITTDAFNDTIDATTLQSSSEDAAVVNTYNGTNDATAGSNGTDTLDVSSSVNNNTSENLDLKASLESIEANSTAEIVDVTATVAHSANNTDADESDRAIPDSIESGMTEATEPSITVQETVEAIHQILLEIHQTTEANEEHVPSLTWTTVHAEVSKELHSTMEDTTSTPTTVESTTSTTTAPIPADCPALKGCLLESCTFGRKYDHRGCPTCHCLPPKDNVNFTCPSLTCQPCLYGHHTDLNGCPTCQCQARPYPPLGERCPQLHCDPCYFGTVKDEYNCETCICIRPNSQECPVLNCLFGPCKYGSLLDEDNCPSCECLPPPPANASDINCTIPSSCPPCHLGYIRDANGCQTCQCKLRGSGSCPSLSSVCQCPHGSYLDSQGCETCSCLPDPTSVSTRACWQLSEEAQRQNQTSGPICTSDGAFAPRQCSKSESKCWCVTSTGITISGFESAPDENANCVCAVELYQVSTLRMIGHHLSCLPNGNYAPIQCDGRYCSCVDEDGKPVGPSVSIQNRDQLRCVGVYQQLHPERFLLHRGSIEHPDFSQHPHDISSSLCLSHLEQVRSAQITDEHILIPVCDANGLYAPVQCDQNERYCWCVDKKTGVEMEGTRRLNARPNCNPA